MPSVIRIAKIATIEVSNAARLGKVSTAVLKQVTQRIGHEVAVDRRLSPA